MILGMKLDNDKPATVQEIEHEAKVANAKPVPSKTPQSDIKLNAPISAEESTAKKAPADETKLISHPIALLGPGSDNAGNNPVAP